VVDREVESVLAALEPVAVERARAVVGRRATALRALERLAVRALLDEQELDAPVGGGLERVLPAAHGAAVPPALLLPAGHGFRLLTRAGPVEMRPRRPQQCLRVRVRLGLRPADDRLPRLVR